MAERGLSEEGLHRLHDTMVGHVDRGAMPGLVTLVARDGQVHVDVIGSPSFDDPRPLSRDAIFRIASLTKPITAAAAMVLVEDRAFGLDSPVAEWLPELAEPRVLRSLESELDDTVPARRAITVEDLLTFRLGFGLVMGLADATPIRSAEAELQLTTLGPPWPPSPHTSDSWMRSFASPPLLCQPGEQWHYNTGAQVLGVLVERAAGCPLGEFMAERLFGPLGMVDTGFSVPPEKLDRLTTAYAPDPVTGAPGVLDGVEDSWWAHPPAMANGAAWLVSTIDDFGAFVRMLEGGGRANGVRILGEESVHQMTTDHLNAEQRAASRLFLGNEGGWGYGMRVPASGGAGSGVPGGFGWDGGAGTSWRTDPATGLTGILFTQRAMTSPELPQVAVDFWVGAYGALSD